MFLLHLFFTIFGQILKKSMTKLFKAFILALCIVSCRPQQIDRIKLSVYDMEFAQEGGEIQVGVISSSKWSVNKQAEWIEVTYTTDSECTLIISPNDTLDRSDSVLFICGTSTAALHISQKHSDVFDILPDTTHFSYKGGDTDIKILCYDQWHIETDSDWIIPDVTEGIGPQTITLTILESFLPNESKGSVIISSSEKKITLEITREARPFVKLDKEKIEIDGDQHDTSLLYLTNDRIIIINNTPWIRTVHHDTLSKRLTLEILRNREYQKREGDIRFICLQDTAIYSTLTIIQGEKIDHPELGFKEGYTLDVSSQAPFTLHPIFTDMTDTTLIWTSDRPEVAKVDQNGVVTALETGECKITITNTYHNVSAEILLKIRLVADSMTVMLGKQNMNINTTAVRFVGEKMVIEVILHPESSYNGDIICYSSDPEVVKIEGFNVECISEGTATITVESLYNGLRSSFKIIVIKL